MLNVLLGMLVAAGADGGAGWQRTGVGLQFCISMLQCTCLDMQAACRRHSLEGSGLVSPICGNEQSLVLQPLLARGSEPKGSRLHRGGRALAHAG